MKVTSKKQKGRLLEDHIADQIIKKGLDPKARRSFGSGAGTREKADIDTSLQILGRNIGIEAKNHAVAKCKVWWEQAQKLEKLGREPVVVYKLKGESLGDSKSILYLDTLLDLLAEKTPEKAIIETADDNRELKWKLEASIRANKALLKEIKNE
ncbi:MAG: hypothetical protein HN402_07960 [Candidatus Scalindua sp.]|jgi:hypothetical protein|nr:hypothetical protein [Candidatus Scalindua sp.]MBT6757791.1 hypothetical protein [Candidatus Jacksonbacteria bacterium]